MSEMHHGLDMRSPAQAELGARILEQGISEASTSVFYCLLSA